MGEDWETRCAELWAQIDVLGEDDFIAAIGTLTGELAADNPVALFERGAAQDSTGHPDVAVPLYESALAAGLSGLRRRRAVIQLASSLRNISQPERSLELLTAEAARPSDELDGAVATFTALTLATLGREREGVAVAVRALAAYLPRYNRSAAAYAEDLLAD